MQGKVSPHFSQGKQRDVGMNIAVSGWLAFWMNDIVLEKNLFSLAKTTTET